MEQLQEYPGYLALIQSGDFKQRVKKAQQLLQSCKICPRNCRVNRLSGRFGRCGTADSTILASFGPHLGEESVLVGHYGSGTVFFSGCNLGCVFCQNYDISHLRQGAEATEEQLAEVFLKIQSLGCHNLNLVTPSHILPQILSALYQAAQAGFVLPVVYNCSGYDSMEALQLLDGIVDIYMPDLKSLEPEFCEKYFDAPDYPDIVRRAILEMSRQVGDFTVDERGIARRGVLVRHLVMPEQEEDSRQIIDFLSRDVPEKLLVNIMDQYRPCAQSGRYPDLDHRTPRTVYERVRGYAGERGLNLA
jgi:putative pyruvate formate lyase activating enzyme